MSERSGRRSRRLARVDCNMGRHRYGSSQSVGGGIERRVCLACAAVSIDLTSATDPVGAYTFIGLGGNDDRE